MSVVVPLFTFNFGDSTIVVPLGEVLAPAAGVTATAIAGQYVPALTDAAASVARRDNYR